MMEMFTIKNTNRKERSMTMTKKMMSKDETARYLSNKKNMKRFIYKLHKYLMVNLEHTGDEKGNFIWLCHPIESGDSLKYYIKFCKSMRLNWEAAADMFQNEDGDHWCNCDCDYLYHLRVNDDGIPYNTL
jgi:hypothetical protein